MKKLLVSLMLALSISRPALADRIEVTTPDGGPPAPVGYNNALPIAAPTATLANGTSTNVTVGAVAQTVTLTSSSWQITINNTSSTNTVYLQPFGGNATTSNFPIAPGQAFTFSCTIPLTSVSLIASGAGTVVGVLAH